MLVLVQKMLELSMRLCKSDRKLLRIIGKLLGYLPVRYSQWMEKRLFEGIWDPTGSYQKKKKVRNIKNKFKNQKRNMSEKNDKKRG